MNIEERNKLIEHIYSLGLVQNYIKKIGFSNDLEIYDDICQEIWLQISEIPCEKFETLLSQGTEKDPLKNIRGYISGIIFKNIRSDSSKIYNKLKKYKQYEFIKDDLVWDKFRNEIPDTITYEIEIENAKKVRKNQKKR